MPDDTSSDFAPAADGTLLQATNLNFSFPGGPALIHQLSLALPAGITLVRGGDGRGKSTLMRLLAGALAAQAGELHIGATSLRQQPAAYRARLFWTEARNEAFDQMTPPDWFASVRKRYPMFDGETLAGLVEGLGLTPHTNKQLFMLSTGSKRKVWMAGALASGAQVTLIDEPFAALDTPSIRFLQRALQDAASTGRAVVIADYDAPEDLALVGVVALGD
ncbi:MAG: ATP-binding cassette domain-containing protein [Polaromonas sp.]|nr:ATP-binding cassette domain-containing protein [Polaromonas sp.]